MNIIELANRAGLNMPDRRNDLWMPQFERFAALVRAEALEEAAKVCDDLVLEHPGRADKTADQCAAAIRGLK